MEFGLHIADYTWSSGQRQLGPALARHVRNAEAAGIQRITVMDHFWQLPGIGPVEHEMLEAYATLGFLVAHTEKALLHTLVTGVIYREPALLAKQVTTLDVLSGGRVGLGIGAAWNEQESRGLGFRLPAGRRAVPPARGDDPDLPADVVGVGGAVRRRDLAARAHAELAAEHRATASVSHDRRRRREEDAAAGRAVRGCLQPRFQSGDRPQARRAARPLRRGRARLRRHREDGDDLRSIPESTPAAVAATVRELAGLGFTATYVYAIGMPEPERVVEVLAGACRAGMTDAAAPRLGASIRSGARGDVNSSAVTCPSGRRCNSRKVV